jgi:LacI family transcriptional regulator
MEADAAIELLLRSRISAMIAVGFFARSGSRSWPQAPFVNVGPRIAGLEERCAVADNLNGAYEATRHLIALGRRVVTSPAPPAATSADRVLLQQGAPGRASRPTCA